MGASSPQGTGKGRPGKPFHDLGQRTLSGLALAILALALTYVGGWAFVGLVVVGAALMSWEWGRIVRGASFDWACAIHIVAVIASALLAGSSQPLFAGIALLIGTFVVLTFTFGSRPLLSCLGVLYVGVPALALVLLRADSPNGLSAVLLILLVVWTVDTGAFIGGRSIGGPKLWPAVSPNKTWAGFICGVGAGVVMGVAFAVWLGSPVLRLAVVALGLAVASQVGDLAESALKRSFGVKDSSHLIPGHGGALDRLDGVVAAASLAALIGHVANIAAPAHALLYGA